MAIAKLDLSGLLELNHQIQTLPENLQRQGGSIIADEAKRAFSESLGAYRSTFSGRTGELVNDVIVEQRGPLTWRLFNASGFAGWFEYVPGTALRWTKEAFTATARRRARKQAGGAYRGRIKVAQGGVGGFSGTKATPTTSSSAVFHPIIIPLGIEHRARMVERLKGLLRSLGATVSGDA